MAADDLIPWQKGQSGNPRGKPKGIYDQFAIAQARNIAASGLTPLQFLTVLYRKDLAELTKLGIDPKTVTLDVRRRAAEAALPYVHRKMPVGVEVKPAQSGTVTAAQLAVLTDDELDQLIAITSKLHTMTENMGDGESEA